MRSNSNTSRTTWAVLASRRRLDGRAAVVGAAEHLRDDGVAEDAEVLDPQNAGLLGRALAVEVDLEPHAAALDVGVEVDELERLTGVG